MFIGGGIYPGGGIPGGGWSIIGGIYGAAIGLYIGGGMEPIGGCYPPSVIGLGIPFRSIYSIKAW